MDKIDKSRGGEAPPDFDDSDFLDDDTPSLGGMSDFERSSYEKQILDLQRKLRDKDSLSQSLMEKLQKDHEADKKNILDKYERVLRESINNYDREKEQLHRDMVALTDQIALLEHENELLKKDIPPEKLTDFDLVVDALHKKNITIEVEENRWVTLYYCIMYIVRKLQEQRPTPVADIFGGSEARFIYNTIKKMLSCPPLPKYQDALPTTNAKNDSLPLKELQQRLLDRFKYEKGSRGYTAQVDVI